MKKEFGTSWFPRVEWKKELGTWWFPGEKGFRCFMVLGWEGLGKAQNEA